MRRPRRARPPYLFLLALHDAALLLAVFLAPIYWSAFSTNVASLEVGGASLGLSGLTLATFFLTLAALAALVWRWLSRTRPAVLPNAVHLPLLLFLAISALATFTTVNLYGSLLELDRLAIGALLFVLVANRALLPAPPAEWTLAFFAAFLPLVFFTSTVGENGMWGLLPSTISWLDLLVWLAAVGVAALWYGSRATPDPVRRWVEAVVLSGCVVAVGAIKEKLFAAFVLVPPNPSWQPFGGFFNQNILAGFLVLLIPIAAALAFTSGSRWPRLTFLLAGLAMLLALAFTESKGAIVALFVAVVVCALLLARVSRRPGRNLRAVLAGLLLLLFLVVVAAAASHGLREKVTGAFGERSASNLFRIYTWRGTWHMALAHPWLGIGPGAFDSAFGQYTIAGFTRAAHQMYLQVAAEQGFFGLAVFLWLLVAVLFTGWRAVRDPQRPFRDRVLAGSALGGLLAVLLHGLLDYGWYIGAINLSFWLVAGLLAHLAHGRAVEIAAPPPVLEPARSKRRRVGEPAPARPAPVTGATAHSLPWPRTSAGSAAAVLLCGLVLILFLSFAVRSDLAQHAKEQGDRAFGLSDEIARSPVQQDPNYSNTDLARSYYRQAVDDYRSAAAYAPLWAGAHEMYARSVELGRGDPAEAEREFRAAVACEPESFQFRLTLAKFYDGQRRWPEAIKGYEEVIGKYFPRHTRALRYFADLYRRTGDEANCVRIYQRLLAIETQPINTVRAIGAEMTVDDNYAYAHYEVGRSVLQAYRQHPDPASFAAAQNHFLRCIAVVADYRAGGKLDEMYRQLHRAHDDRLPGLEWLEAKARFRLAQLLESAGRGSEAPAQRAAAAQVFLNDPKTYPDPGRELARVQQELAREDAGGPQ